MIYRLHRLNSEKETIDAQISTFFNRLIVRGYQESFLRPIFHLAIAHNLERERNPKLAQDSRERIFLHLEYNPLDPPSKLVQKHFDGLMLNPDDGPPLPEILNHKWAPIKLKRLIVAYHRPSNLGDLLRPRTMELESGLPVSALCDEMEEARQQQQQLPTTTTANNNNNRTMTRQRHRLCECTVFSRQDHASASVLRPINR
jgi:hypothetical protein